MLLTSLLACSKDKDDKGDSDLTGTWQLTETSISMGEGNPPWTVVPAQADPVTIEFKSNGTFVSIPDKTYTRYERYHKDSILLSNADNSKTAKLAIAELTNQRLTYFVEVPGIGVCGASPGLKYKRPGH